MSDPEHDDDGHAELPQVAASERDIIMMARALIAPESQDMWATLCLTRRLPPHIGPTCARLVGDALEQVWPALCRRGGAEPGATVRSDAVVRGRLWERHPPTGLTFTGATMALLRWLVATPFAAAPSTHGRLDPMPLSIGDEVVLYLALDASKETPAQHAIANTSFARASGLAWLGFAHVMDGTPEPKLFGPLATGAGAVVVEALTGELARRWRKYEITKRSQRDPHRLVAVGAAQDATLKAFMAACDAANRRDLALFVVDALEPLLLRNVGPLPPALDPSAPLSLRQNARLAAGSLVRALLQWRDWDQQHRAIRFIDDGYQAAQLALHRYEKIGNPGSERAAAWLANLSSLSPDSAVPSSAV